MVCFVCSMYGDLGGATNPSETYCSDRILYDYMSVFPTKNDIGNVRHQTHFIKGTKNGLHDGKITIACV